MNKRICKGCGQEFELRYDNQLYCSTKCRMSYKAQQRRQNTRALPDAHMGMSILEHWRQDNPDKLMATCPVCGKEFVRKSPWQKYCSAACRYVATYGKSREYMKGRICRNCGAIFDASYGSQLYCCNECRLEHTGRIKPAVVREEIEVPVDEQPIFLRKCHDCGRPTTNYRCDKCLSKWRRKHHVKDEIESEEYRCTRRI